MGAVRVVVAMSLAVLCTSVWATDASAQSCTATSNCTNCCGSSGCVWTPRCGAGGPNCSCRTGDCQICASCCCTVSGSQYCSCAKCNNSQVCIVCLTQGAQQLAGDLTSLATRRTLLRGTYGRVRVATHTPPKSLTIRDIQVRPTADGFELTHSVTNASATPIASYVILWELHGKAGVKATFSSHFDSWGLGVPLPPDGMTASRPYIGASSAGALESIEAEVAFVEYTDGRREGRGDQLLGPLLDKKRQDMAEDIRFFAGVLRDSGVDGLRQAVETEMASDSQTRALVASSLLELLTSRPAPNVTALLQKF